MTNKQRFPILGNSQRLDGGAMYGNVPKAMWSRWSATDDQNRILLATRALLIKEENRNILLEAGIGAFFPPKLKERFGVIEDEHVLLQSLQNAGLDNTDIDLIILSHLHFDHAGGLLSAWRKDREYELLFPNAKIIISEQAYERACNPHPRDRASFIPDLMNKLALMQDRIILVNAENCALLGEDYKFHYSNGHTPGLLMTEVIASNFKIFFASDLIPGAPWVHLPVTMGYDRYPETLIDEKRHVLDYLIANDIDLFFTHDPNVAWSKVKKNIDGKYEIYS